MIVWRKQVLEWIIGIDCWNRQWDSGDSGDDAWTAFLAEHPELCEPGVPAREARDS